MPDSAAMSPAASDASSQILLESGTNELEVLVFGLGESVYGINVAKVREVIRPVTTAACPQQPEAVRGIFNLRGRVLPLVDLGFFLKFDPPCEGQRAKQRVIVTEFNGFHAAFLVDRVERIYRISWSQMRAPSDSDRYQNQVITSLTELDGRLVLMLDFESIVDRICIQKSLHIDQVDNKLSIDREAARVVLVEDSHFIRSKMKSVLLNSGYAQVQDYPNGKKAWQALEACVHDAEMIPDVVVSDIEMPEMDGLALTRNIKATAELADVPVILFSSLISPDTRHKGKQVGADEQLAKPQMTELVEVIDRWVGKAQGAAG